MGPWIHSKSHQGPLEDIEDFVYETAQKAKGKMIIKQDVLDNIRNRFNSFYTAVGGNRIDSANAQRALEISVREALAPFAERMDLSDAEEKAVQLLEETAEKLMDPTHKENVVAVLRAVRTRHTRRVLVRTPGQVAHEAFHTSLNGKGSSRYGNGCWATISQDRKDAWEDAAKHLGSAIVAGETVLTTKSGATLSAVNNGRGILGGFRI